MDFVFFLFILPIIAYMYVLLYVRIRKISGNQLLSGTAPVMKFTVIAAIGLIIRELYAVSPGVLPFLFYAVLALLSGIDILIRKIPTELLAVFCVLFVLVIGDSQDHLSHAACAALICSVLLVLRKHIGIALYDIIILFPLLTLSGSTIRQLKFISLFLILWGCAGIILRKTQKQEEPVTVPLVPVAVLCCFLLQRSVTF